MNEEATSTKPQSWQPYRGSNSRTGPPHHFSGRISPGSNFGLSHGTSPAALSRYRPPQAAPGNCSVARRRCDARSGSADHRPFRCRNASMLLCAAPHRLGPHPVASCGTLLLELLKLGRRSGSARAASRSPSPWLAASSQNGCWSRRPPGPAILPLIRASAPHRTGGTTHAPRETKPGNSRGPAHPSPRWCWPAARSG